MPEPVYLEEILLHRFRNHQHTRLAPGRAPLVVLTGPNGAGKTNILEAISLFSVGRGLRRAATADMARQDGARQDGGQQNETTENAAGEGFQLKADILPERHLPPLSLRLTTTPPHLNRRLLHINDAPAPLSSLGDWLGILWLTPAMDRLFSEAPAARRRFLDRLTLALHPQHARHAGRYEKAMRARSRLLADDRAADPLWLTTLEQEMATHGALLTTARQQTIAALDALLGALPDTGFPRAALTLLAHGAEAPHGMDARAADRDDLAAALRTARPRDRAAKRATLGPHRADLAVFYREKHMPAGLSSTGEQKALLVGILLAHAALVGKESGHMPLLLLDEALAHLDPGRRQALFARLAALGGQTWMSGTEARLFAAAQGAHFAVAAGAVTPA